MQKKYTLIFIAVIGLISLGFGYYLWVLYMLHPFHINHYTEEFSPIVSPTQKYELLQTNVVDEDEIAGYSFIVWEKDKKKATEYIAPDYYRKQDRFLLAWGDTEDVVWVYSGDVGIFYWEIEENNWVKKRLTKENDLVPPLPTLFKKELQGSAISKILIEEGYWE